MKETRHYRVSGIVNEIVDILDGNPLTLHEIRERLMKYSYSKVSNALHNSVRTGKVKIHTKGYNGGRTGKYEAA